MIVSVGLILSVLVTQQVAMALEASELSVIQGNGVFTKNLYKELSKEDGNVFFSPISAHAVLAMAYQGADGITKDAFASTLNVPDEKVAADGYKQIIERLNSVQDVTLLMANKVFLQKEFQPQDGFGKSVKENFKSELEQLNFKENVKSAGVINSWVESKTNNKIKDLISSDSLDADTRLVLVNAIYFKGDWATKFDKANTQKKPFYLNEKDTVDVDMMFRKGDYKYKFDRDLDAQVLELPYKNKALSLIVVLPNDKNGIKALEAKLAETDISKITENMYNSDVEVYLPRFKIETTINLKDSLTKIGLGNIFSAKANFSKMITGGEPLYVSEAIQKAFIEVNEEGSEAAAATGVLIRKKRGATLSRIFLAEHPFVFCLVYHEPQSHEGSKVAHLLFYGKLTDPPKALTMHEEL